ncbi:redoxin domain-containing protein [Candidatus Protofrankia californiensis]|uniref:redoxin domain-containing protein n=1 Tax=Candidatus Protofrankia californiensis TaxID=1839754 RepID=UPI00202B6209|nr:redoxin domain-containing protein [Candidatus Protofrankia californiensis]
MSTLLTKGPIVVVFYRGAWRPYCNLQLNAFQAALDEIEAAGATLVAISPQTPDNSLTFAEQQPPPAYPGATGRCCTCPWQESNLRPTA